MTTPVIVQKFGPEDASFSLDALNQNFAAMVAAINALAAETVLQLGVTPGNLSGYLPITGGTLAGQLTAPSMLVGPVGGTQYPVVTTNDAATAGVRGVVKQAAANVDASASAVAVASANAAAQTGAYVQADVQTIATLANELKTDMTQLVTDFNAAVTRLNALQAAMRTAGQLAP